MDFLDYSRLVSKLGKLLNYHLSDFQKNIGCPALVVTSGTVVLSSSVTALVVVSANIFVRLINQVSVKQRENKMNFDLLLVQSTM